jgi:S1-C subfamily serine protease
MREDRVLPALFACLRAFCCLAAGSLTLLAGSVTYAQQGPGVFAYRWNGAPPAEAITPGDVREALMWTGHLEAVFRGELDVVVRKAAQAWQTSKGHAPTDKLPDDQVMELVSQALKERDEVGWSVLRDSAVGIAFGVPTKLVTFGAPRSEGGALWYHGGGAISQSVGVHLGFPSCRSMDAIYRSVTARATSRARHDNGFVALFRQGDRNSYIKWTCYTAGSVSSEMTVPVEMLETHRGLFAAMAGSLTILRSPDPTIRPRPKIEELPLAPSGFSDQPADRPQPQAKAKPAKPGAVDDSGKTDALKLEVRDGPDLRADEVFEKAAGAVYKVRADKRFGSAVAISETELLTNCHVVVDLGEVKIAREKHELTAKVVSRNPDADRCVLRAEAKLPKWVTVRPYDDIKVGERAVTIGTPQGLELTVAEGIVSSKRTFNQSRVIQTSAPISQGSSGGGLFDARGHLLGITTFYFKVGQNLNFAVAAEEYAQEREEPAIR